MYRLRFMEPPGTGSGPLRNRWSNFKKLMFESNPNVWFERAILKLADPDWQAENNVPVDLHADLVPVLRIEGGIGNPEGPHIRLDLNHYMQHTLRKDIVFVFNGEGWTPDLVVPYKTALEEVVRDEVGYNFVCGLEVGGDWAYCR